jgi:hypothetical protein
VAGDAELPHQVEQGNRHLALGPQLLEHAEERQACTSTRLGVEPAADQLEAFDLGVAGQIGPGSLGHGMVGGRHRTLA